MSLPETEFVSQFLIINFLANVIHVKEFVQCFSEKWYQFFLYKINQSLLTHGGIIAPLTIELTNTSEQLFGFYRKIDVEFIFDNAWNSFCNLNISALFDEFLG